MVILMDYPDAKDWYVAEISQVLPDRFTVNEYITKASPLKGYKQASRKERIKALKGVAFLRTWCKDKGKGEATNIPPPSSQRKGGLLVEMEAPCSLLGRQINCCRSEMLSWIAKDACARHPGLWRQH